MLIEAALKQLLEQNTGIIALVGDRVYPVMMPQAEKNRMHYPAVVFELTGRERQQSHDGPSGEVRSSFRVNCLGHKYLDVKTLADKVRLALNGKSAELQNLYGNDVGGVYLEDESDQFLFNEVTQLSLYHVPMDFLIDHAEEN